jgi:hypothetical protein
MQTSLIRQFVNNDCVEALTYQQGNASTEEYDWAVLYWENHFLRYRNIFDAEGRTGNRTFAQPQIGIPFGRHFVVDQNGEVVLPFFGHDPLLAQQTIYNAYGGDCDTDGIHDAWEGEHFGDLDETPAGDPDGDGTSNQDEHDGGTDPTDARSCQRIHLIKRAGAPYFEFRVRAAEWWLAGQTRLYTVEETDDPGPDIWSDVQGAERLSGEGWLTPMVPGSARLTFYQLRSWLE